MFAVEGFRIERYCNEIVLDVMQLRSSHSILWQSFQIMFTEKTILRLFYDFIIYEPRTGLA